jgi:hypothetical protein
VLSAHAITAPVRSTASSLPGEDGDRRPRGCAAAQMEQPWPVALGQEEEPVAAVGALLEVARPTQVDRPSGGASGDPRDEQMLRALPGDSPDVVVGE